MTGFKVAILEKIIKWLVGGDAFTLITEMVAVLMDEDKTNDEKRKIVKDAVMPIAKNVGKFLLSTAIAYAVDKAKEATIKG